ncbi:P2R1A-PPP2R2A-interacting phosphatase regulator 1-like isoform X2 [Myotis daubentonii]|nr:P2R1A-PPP2R2A-interacting phosphatase regulator 1-like isoform X2 [Myotis daubentonii]
MDLITKEAMNEWEIQTTIQIHQSWEEKVNLGEELAQSDVESSQSAQGIINQIVASETSDLLIKRKEGNMHSDFFFPNEEIKP